MTKQPGAKEYLEANGYEIGAMNSAEIIDAMEGYAASKNLRSEEEVRQRLKVLEEESMELQNRGNVQATLFADLEISLLKWYLKEGE